MTPSHGRLRPRRLFAAGVSTYGVGLLGWLFWPAFRESFIGKVVGIPPFSIYILEHLGVPGLTAHQDCDWMWCRPTIFGVALTTAVWLGVAWLGSIGIARLSRSMRTRAGGR
jgi:hypothetical protein